MPDASAPKPKTAKPKAVAASKRAAVPVKHVSPEATEEAAKNGEVKAAPIDTDEKPPEPSAVDRAEDSLDEVGRQIGRLFVGVTRRLTKAAAVAREEMEDLWAEAQSIRRGDTK